VLARAEPARDMGPRRFRVAVHQLGRRASRRLDEVAVALELGKAQHRHAALALAQELARAAQLEVAARHLEAVGVLVDDLQPLARRGGEVVREKQDADALAGPAADAAAQLVELREAEALR